MIKLKKILFELNIKPQDITIGQFKEFIVEFEKQQKKQKTVSKISNIVGSLISMATNAGIDKLIPGASAAINTTSLSPENIGTAVMILLSKFGNMNDEESKGTFAQLFDLDDQYVAIMDKAVKAGFDKHMRDAIIPKIKNIKDDNVKLATVLNANIELENWLAHKYNGKRLYGLNIPDELRQMYNP